MALNIKPLFPLIQVNANSDPYRVVSKEMKEHEVKPDKKRPNKLKINKHHEEGDSEEEQQKLKMIERLYILD